eukprot:a340379_46.p1 GENE.a340379_46~~a340379_46.p1  ORF type:complete len:326 (-),score=107.39 a340379_46:29-979(-)
MRFRTSISTRHEEIVQDLSYSWDGSRLATAGGDSTIKVFDQSETGEWVLSASWKAHSASVWKLAWAHPEFGQVLASCSFDNTVCIWEQDGTAEEGGRSVWSKRATLVDSRESVSDCRFAPRNQGLRLAACSAGGTVRLYEAPDVVNLSVWTLVDQIEAKSNGGNAISWNPSRFSPPMLATCGAAHDAQIWQFDEGYRRWHVAGTLPGHTAEIHDVAWGPNMGRRHEVVATACKDGHVRLFKVVINLDAGTTDTSLVAELFHRDLCEVWRVQWNVTGTVLASSGDDGTVRLWKRSPLVDEWRPFLQITSDDAEPARE